MKKVMTGFAVMLVVMSCQDHSAGSDASMYDTSAKSTTGAAAIARDSIATALAADSSGSKDSAKSGSDSAATGHGGVPAGTIDSGMNNAGAQKHHTGKRKK